MKKEKYLIVGLTKEKKIPKYDVVYIGVGNEKTGEEFRIFMTPLEMMIFIAECSKLLAKNNFIKHK